jgi:hypothetical protein
MNNLDKLLIMRSKISHKKFSSHAWEEFQVVLSLHVQLHLKWEEKLFVNNGSTHSRWVQILYIQTHNLVITYFLYKICTQCAFCVHSCWVHPDT